MEMKLFLQIYIVHILFVIIYKQTKVSGSFQGQ